MHGHMESHWELTDALFDFFSLYNDYEYVRSVDDVYDLVDDVQEQNELASEITEVLSSPFVQQDFDEV